MSYASNAPSASYEESGDHADLRGVVAEFAAEQLAPHVAHWNSQHEVPLDAVKQMGELGLFGLGGPEEFGGAGDFTSLCIAIEEIGRVDQSLGVTLEAAAGLGTALIVEHGTREQQERWLPDLLAGRALAGFGLTEPGSGSDAGALSTSAREDDDGWLIDGSKQFITNSGTAITSVIVVGARTGRREDGAAEISTFLVPAGTPGLTVEPAYAKLGWHASDTHPLTFERVRVPHANLLGARGRGLAYLLRGLDDGRVGLAALALGCIRACRDLAAAYAKERTAFGASIGSRQGVAFQIADLDVMERAARLLVYSAAAMRDAGVPDRGAYHRAASIAKLYASESAVTASRVALQVFGGYGFMEEFPIARFYRDAKVLEIGEGTSEVQRLIIARGLGLPVR